MAIGGDPDSCSRADSRAWGDRRVDQLILMVQAG